MPVVVRATRAAARCALCHDSFERASDHEACRCCGARLHSECWRWLSGRCPTLGCSARPEVLRITLEPPLFNRWELLGLLALGLCPTALLLLLVTLAEGATIGSSIF